MNRKILVVFFVFSVSAVNLYAQSDEFDFAFNFGSFGWGMNISPDKKEGNFTYNLLNLYIEHLTSHIGMEISPFNSWTNYSHSNIIMNFINVRFFYNLANWGKYDDEGELRGSDYFLVGPFVSLNYLRLGNNQPLNANHIQINAGFKMLAMFDFFRYFGKEGLPLGLQLFNIEAGYRFSNYVFNRHQFYFNLSTDILALVALIGIFSGEPEEVKQQKKDVR